MRLLRMLLLVAAMSFIVALLQSFAGAVEVWPEVELNDGNAGGRHAMRRGPGSYLSMFKISAYWLLFALWVWTLDWVNRDAWAMRKNYAMWNSVVFFTFFISLLLFWLLPSFFIGFLLLLLAYGGSVTAYVLVRNKAAESHQQVMTRDHLWHLVTGKEKKNPHEKGAPVFLDAAGGAGEREDKANMIKAKQAPGFIWVKDLIANLVSERGDAARFDFTQDAVMVRYQVDGVWHSNEPLERENGDAQLLVMKTLSALDPEERGKRQSGGFFASLDKKKFSCRLISQGTSDGERVILKLEEGTQKHHTMQDLGMGEEQSTQLKELLMSDAGMLLFSSLPAGGLTTTIDVCLEETDRLLRSFSAVEEAERSDREIENVEVTTYQRARGETPATVLPQLIRTYPDVLVVRKVEDMESFKILCEQVGEKRLVITSNRAKNAVDSLIRILALKVSPRDVADALTAVIYGRLLRKLCAVCKVAYEPPQDVLKKLGLSGAKVSTLCREPDLEEVSKPCMECGGIGYLGRTAIFEILAVNDVVRETMAQHPQPERLKKAARAAGMRSLQQEGIRLVVRGETSLPELMRVLKQ